MAGIRYFSLHYRAFETFGIFGLLTFIPLIYDLSYGFWIDYDCLVVSLLMA